MTKETKYKLLLIGTCLLAFFVAEIFLFNKNLLIESNLVEKTYSVNQGVLHQFQTLNESIISTGNDSNISFENINLRVKEISINCENSISGSDAQVFFRGNNEPYTESKSVRYETSSEIKTIILDQFLGLRKAPFVSGLRFDLTDIPGDIVTCDSFVIRSPTTLKTNVGRLAIYLSVVIIIFIYKTKLKIPRITDKILQWTFGIALSILLGNKLIPFAKSSGMIPVVLLSILLFSFSTTLSLKFIYKKPETFQGDTTSFWAQYKYEILLTSILLITTLPLLRQSYFYYDDWWNIGNKALLNKQFFFSVGRPIQFLVLAYFDNITIQNAFIIKWVFLFATILYTLILYRWISSKTKNNSLAFVLAAILGLFEPVMDLLGYAATGAITISLLFSAGSVISFEQVFASYHRKETKRGLLYTAFTIMLIFTACFAYQLGPQIVFLFFTIELFFGQNIHSIIKKNLSYLVLFAFSNVAYLLFVKFTNLIYTVELQTNRSQIINSGTELMSKIPFYVSVMKQAINQIVVAFTGNQFVLERYHGYYVTLSDNLGGKFLFSIVIVFILIALIQFWRKTKNLIGLALLLCYFPMSYFVFIILSENGYLTYYAFASISILMFYFMMGFSLTIRFVLRMIAKSNLFTFWQNLDLTAILTPLLIICAFVSNSYITDFYINFNTSIYNYIKHNLGAALQSGTINRIHVFGKISPITADVYSQFVVETALRELNRDSSDYLITYSGNRDYPASLPEAVYLTSENKLTESDKATLGDFYSLDLKYRQYYLQTVPSAEDRMELRRIFNKSELIPSDQSPDTLVIDITWTTYEYYNQE